jgi:hypothetical protein
VASFLIVTHSTSGNITGSGSEWYRRIIHEKAHAQKEQLRDMVFFFPRTIGSAAGMLYVGVTYVLIHQNPNRDGHERGITMEIEENEIHFISDACILLACNRYHLFHSSSFLPSQASERAKRKEQQIPREKQANV